ncbi:hypothetical protein Val02_03300 [Virgisporangium aliadipatigenens]|uniref:Methyltransferase type 11 domain-containing protein n=1 Tax=Virgisporangium aliadipatigenens TaxID=741659 RepID=A0A8J3YE55_9ACTN|nr:methyltransferase domain-containing protein [Virgisporangium aliadipatigenens]GIJ43444.1 hypothetical protein Val02_03300 [Virgisporangium aliadipatigenens]
MAPVSHPVFARVYQRVSVSMDRAGAAAAHYPGSVTEVLAVEPEPRLRAAGVVAARAAPVPVRVLAGTAEALPFPDASFDAAVCALVLCSVPAGFVVDEVERFRFPPAGPPGPAAPHVRGSATAP